MISALASGHGCVSRYARRHQRSAWWAGLDVEALAMHGPPAAVQPPRVPRNPLRPSTASPTQSHTQTALRTGGALVAQVSCPAGNPCNARTYSCDFLVRAGLEKRCRVVNRPKPHQHRSNTTKRDLASPVASAPHPFPLPGRASASAARPGSSPCSCLAVSVSSGCGISDGPAPVPGSPRHCRPWASRNTASTRHAAPGGSRARPRGCHGGSGSFWGHPTRGEARVIAWLSCARGKSGGVSKGPRAEPGGPHA